MNNMLSYEDKNTIIHRLSGFTKLLFFIGWCITSALTYDTYVLAAMLIISIVLFAISKTEWKQISAVFKLIVIFMILNLIAIFIMSPYRGTEIYGTMTVIWNKIPGHALTKEELFLFLNMILKYFTMAPAIFIFLVTTDPSELAASLNMVGVPYMGAYAVSIAIRYIPDVQDDYHRIRNAQEARGIEMSKKAKLIDRIKRTSSIIFPLIFSMMERIDVVSNALELRGFGKNKKRTWYVAKKLETADIIAIIFIAVFCIGSLVYTYYDGSRFYNPFI